VASKFASFHLRFCDMALLLWSIDKKCLGEGGVVEVPLFNIRVRLGVVM